MLGEKFRLDNAGFFKLGENFLAVLAVCGRRAIDSERELAELQRKRELRHGPRGGVLGTDEHRARAAVRWP